MRGLYRQYFDGLVAANLSLAVHYSSVGRYSRYGSWGLMEAQDQDRRWGNALVFRWAMRLVI